MQTKSPITTNKLGLLFYLSLLTLLLVLFEISIVIRCSGIYLGDFKLIANHLQIPLGILPAVAFFLLAQFLVHFAFLLTIWCVAKVLAAGLHLSTKKLDILGVSLWFLALITVLLANRYYFPNAKAADLLFGGMPDDWVYYLLICGCVLLALAILLACFFYLRLINLCIIFLLLSVLFFFKQHTIPADAATEDKPNIIIIGMDSVRPDFLSFFGSHLRTPHIDYFLNQAAVFAEALTPIARTYPAWVSILSGQYPRVSGVRTNLQNQIQINFNSMLPNQLRQYGYETIFATDETRFSNIDHQFGFNQLATPPLGFNDFLVGTLNDFPLSNLLVNTVIGKYLFPYSYANRGVYVTYDPDTFLQRLRLLLDKPRHKPVFLAVHFCLPHYPYAWAGISAHNISLRHYQAAITRVDRQLQDLMAVLNANNFLKHAVVVLLSDHGEGVERAGDRITDAESFIPGKENTLKQIPHFYPPLAKNEKVNTSGGHGTDVLGLPQYHTVLAFRTFGLTANQQKVFPGIVSLLDIKPTLLQMLHKPYAEENGRGLWEQIISAKLQTLPKHFFIESDFSPNAIRSAHPEIRKVLFEGIDYFHIDPKTLRVLVKKNMFQLIMSSKQYADFYGSWVLALYPQAATMTPILVNLENGLWTNDLTTEFAKQSPASIMLQALKSFYKEDIQRPITHASFSRGREKEVFYA